MVKEEGYVCVWRYLHWDSKSPNNSFVAWVQDSEIIINDSSVHLGINKYSK